MDDPRFTCFSSDPKFRTVPKKHRKVEIDKRFASMFKDEKFTSKKSKVDKRGRPVKVDSKENFRKYYNLKKEEEEDEKDDSESENDDEMKEKVKKKLKDLSVDYARGEGILDSESSSSEEEIEEEQHQEEEEIDEEVQFDKWGELDHDTERTEEATKRLAVCNMDWDRVGAEDIFIAMSSFCPNNGSVKCVNLFISEFGKKRLAEEDRLGPEELRMNREDKRGKEEDSSSDENEEEDQETIDKKTMEKVRKYQVNRLKYYYAVAEFDSADSANKVYKECDGAEYELSATRFDLRFIPDEMEFESEDLKGTCSSLPDPDKYKPKMFMTTALQQGKVDLTWDETDPQRIAAMKRAFEDDEDEDLKQLIASGESDEGEENGDEDVDAIAKYKQLLLGISAEKREKEEEIGNMEVVFKDEVQDLEEEDQADVEKMTPWEKYLHKKKEKRKARLAKREQQKEQESEEEEKISDDELPEGVDFDDDFFKQDLDEGDLDEEPTGKRMKKKRLSKKEKQKKKKEKEEEKEREAKSDLNLLVMDSEDEERSHFDYKEIVKQESKKSKKKLSKKNMMKRKREEIEQAQKGNDFEIDLKDKRFKAVFDNADFNVDPSNPSFKKTKSMQKIIDEKQSRFSNLDNTSKKQKKNNLETSKNNNLDNLLKSVQKKSKNKKK